MFLFAGFRRCVYRLYPSQLSQRILGNLTGDTIIWHEHANNMIVNSLISIMLFAIPLVLRILGRKLWTVTLRALSGLLIVIQLIALLSLSTNAATQKDKTGYLSVSGLYDVAPKHNIVILLLDRLDNRYIENILRKTALFRSSRRLYTFTNNMSLYSQTFPSVPNMFTGRDHFFDRSTASYMKDAWQTSMFLPNLKDSGYAITMYMDKGYTYSDIDDLRHTVQNAIHLELKVDQRRAMKEVLTLSAYRYAPYALKPYFWTSSDRFSNLVYTPSEQEPYITDDVQQSVGTKRSYS